MTDARSLTISPRIRTRVFTVRGVIVAASLLFLLVGPVLRENDIVGSVLVGSLLALMGLTTLITHLVALRLSRRVTAEWFSPSAEVRAGLETVCVLHLSRLKLFPFICLDISLHFRNSTLMVSPCRVGSGSEQEVRIPYRIAFPHRGVWTLERVCARAQDRFGFHLVSWDIPLASQDIIVTPDPLSSPNFPVLSSTNRPGDLILDLHHRQGDPYDLKAYHPTDGVRKIVWKVYAKTGELLSRHPEASMNPEGQVLVYVIADETEDHVCGRALTYFRELEDMGLDLAVGCLGMGDAPYARTAHEAEQMLIESVWSTRGRRPLHDLTSLIDQYRARNTGTAIDRIVLFCSREHLADASSLPAFIEVGAAIQRELIKPVYFLVGREDHRSQQLSENWRKRITEWFVEGDEPGRMDGQPIQVPTEFYSQCVRNEWQIFT